MAPDGEEQVFQPAGGAKPDDIKASGVKWRPNRAPPSPRVKWGVLGGLTLRLLLECREKVKHKWEEAKASHAEQTKRGD